MNGTPATTDAVPAEKPTITVTLDGGLVIDVKKADGLSDVIVRVEDIDIEGLEPKDLQKDADGREYFLSIWD